MKCIVSNKDGLIKRTSDESAQLMVDTGDWTYIPKREWKEKVRDRKKE